MPPGTVGAGRRCHGEGRAGQRRSLLRSAGPGRRQSLLPRLPAGSRPPARPTPQTVISGVGTRHGEPSRAEAACPGHSEGMLWGRLSHAKIPNPKVPEAVFSRAGIGVGGADRLLAKNFLHSEVRLQNMEELLKTLNTKELRVASTTYVSGLASLACCHVCTGYSSVYDLVSDQVTDTRE